MSWWRHALPMIYNCSMRCTSDPKSFRSHREIVLLWLYRFIKLLNFFCWNREDWVQFDTLVEHVEQSSKPWLDCLNLTKQGLQRNFSWVRDNRWFCSRYCAFVKSSWRCRFCSCWFCSCMIWSRLAIVVLYSSHLRHFLIGKGSDKHLAILSMIPFLGVVSSATFFVVWVKYFYSLLLSLFLWV